MGAGLEERRGSGVRRAGLAPGERSRAQRVPGFRDGDSPRREDYGHAQEDQENFG